MARHDYPSTPASEAESSEGGQNIHTVIFGDVEVIPKYESLYREEIIGEDSVDVLYVCPRCFKYTVDPVPFLIHRDHCNVSAGALGKLEYAKDHLQLFEVDGAQHQLFAQNLSNFAKLFIENKSVCYDVHTFTYFILVEISDKEPIGQIVGFFSKEKLSWDNNNLACIVVFPPWQRRGLGQLLMAASYALGAREGKPGGPERPLSDLGRESYLAYWSRTLANYVLTRPNNRPLSIEDISQALFMRPEDIVTTITHMDVAGPERADKRVTLKKQAIRAWLELHGGGSIPPLELNGTANDG